MTDPKSSQKGLDTLVEHIRNIYPDLEKDVEKAYSRLPTEFLPFFPEAGGTKKDA